MKPLESRARLADYSSGCGLAFIALLALLHLLKPDMDPSWNFISEYEVGSFGWLMQLAFLTLSLSCIFLSLLLWKQIRIIGKIGLVMLLISAAGMIIAAVFKTDPLNTPAASATPSGKLHQLGAMLDQIPVAAIFMTIAIFRKKEWKINKLLLILSLAFVWFGFLYFVGSVRSQFPAGGKFGPTVLVGWQNRLMILSQAVWLIIIAREVRRQSVKAPALRGLLH
jgi:hypothetical protein